MTNYADAKTGDYEGFVVMYFPGASFQIEPYTENVDGYAPGSWIIEYTDSSKNITVGRDGTGEILITEDLIGIYDNKSNSYTMRFEKYVRTE